MYKHQKQNLITLICIYVGFPIIFLGALTLSVWFFVLENDKLAGILTLISFICMIIGLIMLRWLQGHFYKFYKANIKFLTSVKDYGIKGVPNNKFSDFKIPIDDLPDRLLFLEEVKGIYCTMINEKKYIFDMRGWLLKKYYIYELLLTMIQLRYCQNKSENLLLSLETKYDSVSIEFKINSKKRVIYKLISNNYTVVHKRYLKNTKNKIKFLSQVNKNSINQLYNLKCN